MQQLSDESVVTVRGALRVIVRAHLSSWWRVLLLAAGVTAVLVVGFMATVLLANPTVQQLSEAVAEGTQVATLVLLTTNGWAVIPVLLMLCAALTYLGMVHHIADGALTDGMVRAGVALQSTIRRMGPAILVIATWLVAVAALLALAPAITVLAVLALALKPLLRERMLLGRWPSTRVLALAAIPFLAGLVVAVRWSLVLPEVFVAQQSWRRALWSSWHRTEGRAWRIAGTLLIAVGTAVAGTWALTLASYFITEAWIALLVEFIGVVLFAPLPIVALLVLYRNLGGRASPSSLARTGLVLGGGGRALPIVLSVVMATTLLTPVPPASAEGTEPAPVDPVTTSVSHDIAPMWSFEFGQGGAVTGTIDYDPSDVPEATPDATPGGTVTLWKRDAAGDSAVGSPAPVAGGGFTVDTVGVLPGTTHLWLSYSGDEVFTAATSDESSVTVMKGMVDVTYSVTGLSETPTIGDTVTLRAEVLGGELAGHPVTAPIEFYDPDTSRLLGSAPLVDGIAQVPYVLTSRTIRLVVGAEDPLYWVIGGEMPPFSDVTPAASSMTLSIAPTAEDGDTIDFVAEVRGPSGVPVSGTVQFFYEVNVYNPYVRQIGVASVSSGIATLPVCVSLHNTCNGEANWLTTLWQGPGGSLPVWAEFTPDPADAKSRLLLPSHSSPTPITVVAEGTIVGSCKRVTFEQRGAMGLKTSLTDFGSPTIEASTSCVDGAPGHVHGYAGDTFLTVRALPHPGFELEHWSHGGVIIGTTPTLVWRLPSDEISDEAVYATYRLTCLPYSVTVTGHGSLMGAVGNGTNAFTSDGTGLCRHPASGDRGFFFGSKAQLEVGAEMNPATREQDAYYRVISATTPVTVQPGSRFQSARASVVLSFTAGTTPAFTLQFGPVCRQVDGVADDNGRAQLLSAPNCQAPAGNGYIRGSSVDFSAHIDDPDLVLTGWLVDGQPVPELGAEPRSAVTVGAGARTTVALETTGCFPITVLVEQTPVLRGAARPAVDIVPAANCGDGSERWRSGTEVTLSPAHSMLFGFGGWTDAGEHKPVTFSKEMTGPRTLIVEASITTTAHFYRPSDCSTITVLGSLAKDSVTTDAYGCGPGRYHDRTRALVNDRPDVTLRQLKEDSHPQVSFRDTPITVYFPEQTQVATATVTERLTLPNGSTWQRRTDQACDGGSCLLFVRGDVTVQGFICTNLDPVVNITYAGNSRVYQPSNFGSDMGEFNWISSDNRSNCGSNSAPGYRWDSGTEVTLRTEAPALGFEFLGWGDVTNQTGTEIFTTREEGDGRHPIAVLVETDDVSPKVRAEVNYQVHCRALTLGEGVSIVEPRGSCGYGNNSYIVGTFVQVAANPSSGGRSFDGWRGGVISGTAGALEDGRIGGWTLVGDDTRVSANYPSSSSKFLNDLAKTGKFFVGVVSLALTSALPVACPPCGLALSALSAASILLGMIPVFGNALSSALDLINPLNLLECATRWGMDSQAKNSQLSEMSPVAKTGVKSVRFMYETTISSSGEAIKKLSTSTTFTKGMAGASFAYGLYEHRIDQMDLAYQNAEDLRNTSGWNSCMSEKYRVPS